MKYWSLTPARLWGCVTTDDTTRYILRRDLSRRGFVTLLAPSPRRRLAQGSRATTRH
jgi:hypothetical protein